MGYAMNQLACIGHLLCTIHVLRSGRIVAAFIPNGDVLHQKLVSISTRHYFVKRSICLCFYKFWWYLLSSVAFLQTSMELLFGLIERSLGRLFESQNNQMRWQAELLLNIIRMVDPRFWVAPKRVGVKFYSNSNFMDSHSSCSMCILVPPDFSLIIDLLLEYCTQPWGGPPLFDENMVRPG